MNTTQAIEAALDVCPDRTVFVTKKASYHRHNPADGIRREYTISIIPGIGGSECSQFTDDSFTKAFKKLQAEFKPLSFAPIPDGAERHNPDNLTPEQVGEGHRLLITEEVDGLGHTVKDSGFWDPCSNQWARGGSDDGFWHWGKLSTISVPLSTPYPDGSRIVDGQLVKPWVPKFKVGDRVKVNLYAGASEIGRISRAEAPTDIQPRPYVVEYEKGGGSGGWVFENQLEPAPWTLSRHLPGFRPLRDGEEWHGSSDEWNESDLLEGERPVLQGEQYKKGDIRWNGGFGPWEEVEEDGHADGLLKGHTRFKTRRPLPEPQPEPAKVPLGPADWMKDGPWWVAPKKTKECAHLVTSVTPEGLVYDAGSMSHERATDYERSNDGITWQPCWKEQP